MPPEGYYERKKAREQEDLKAREQRLLNQLAASIEKTLQLNRKFALELQYGKIHLN
jgi:hypothetical protein